MSQKLRYNEPLSLDPECTVHSIVTLELDDAVKLTRYLHPEANYSYADALNEFMVIHWAWIVDE